MHLVCDVLKISDELLMKRFLIIGLFLLLGLVGYSQGEWNNWNFGWYSAINFNSGSPLPSPLTPMTEANGSSASISDSLGNLLFYSDGLYVFDKHNNIMPNGSGLIGCYNNPQPVYAVPKLGDYNKYFLFTVGPKYGTNAYVGLAYSVIDMTLNGGFGDIVLGQKNILVVGGDSATIQLTGTKHANNKDVWIVTRRASSHGKDKYLAFLVTNAGIITPPVVSTSDLNNHNPFQSNYYEGHMRISPDGNHLICADSLLSVCTFNKNTGVVTTLFTIDVILGLGYGHDPIGVMFSNNCK